MADVLKLKGMNVVMRNLTRAKGVIASGVARGLKKGGLHLQRKSQEIVPHDLGNLEGSVFCRNVGGRGFDTDIIVGYGGELCNYAIFVHEDLNKAHGKVFNIKYAKEIAAGTMSNRGENQQAKFLEKPAREERKSILKIIHREARL